MDYIIYIVLGVLGVIFFVAKGFSRGKSKDRKSRKFMEGYKRGDSSKQKE